MFQKFAFSGVADAAATSCARNPENPALRKQCGLRKRPIDNLTSPSRKKSQGSQPDAVADSKTKGQAGSSQVIDGLGVPEKLGDKPLRLVIVGHNPSEHAWRSGHYYSNPSNKMWPLLISTGIAPPGTTGPEADDSMPVAVGVGFVDVGCGVPGTVSAEFKAEVFMDWRTSFYRRLEEHVKRACQSIGCTCGRCGAPRVVAFSGKRQFLELLNVGLKGKAKTASVDIGVQTKLPAGWPLAPDTEVWVLTSTSGASALTTEQRAAPYKALAERMKGVPWPLWEVGMAPGCCVGGSAQVLMPPAPAAVTERAVLTVATALTEPTAVTVATTVPTATAATAMPHA